MKRLVISISVLFIALVITSIVIAIVMTQGNSHPSLKLPPGWDSCSDEQLKDWSDYLDAEGYKEKAILDYFSPDKKNYIGMTYQPASPSSVFSALPDTDNVEDIEEYIRGNEAEIQEYINSRYSRQVEAEAQSLDCGQAVLTLKAGSAENRAKEMFVFKNEKFVYIVYFNLPEDGKYILENLQVE